MLHQARNVDAEIEEVGYLQGGGPVIWRLRPLAVSFLVFPFLHFFLGFCCCWCCCFSSFSSSSCFLFQMIVSFCSSGAFCCPVWVHVHLFS